ncbi:minor capsid protein [Paenibacillus sp. L3-i20]|uniref:minor capsid protein n=1 Tax=Paenibacillus sp. L3-i20 TaxID=2905833 RepID=UPI001EE01DB0|nr:minor capsid protein [Paenibacillus sp. L3-i20]
MREAVEEAIQKGWDTPRIARRIQDIAREGYHNSVRLARTEMNRAAGQGASHLFMQNADLLEGKRWNATLDSKTAPKDAANDGKIYDLAYDTPEMPGIPGARMPNHPHCRCKWTPKLASLGVRDGERIARGDGDTQDAFGERIYTKAKDYQAYAKERGIDLDERLRNDNPSRYLRRNERGPAQVIAKATTAAAVIAPWLAETKQLLGAGVDSEEQARQVGDVVRKELERRVAEVAPALQLRIDLLTDEADALYEESREKTDAILAMAWSDPNYNERYKEYNTWSVENSRQLTAKRQELDTAKKALTRLRGEEAIKALAEIRPMGSNKAHNWESGSHTKAKDAIMRAQRYYPTDWLEKSHSFNNLDAKVVSRGYYSGGLKGHIADFKISGSTDDSLTRVSVHEFGHRFEHVIPGIKKLEKEFYDRRTAGESLEWLGEGLASSGYAKSEKARFDKFLSRYMGKDYGNKETSYFEIFTMGAESVFTGSYKIESDPDYYNFVLGVLASK